MRWIVFVVIGVLFFGCAHKIEKEKTEKAPERVITRDEAYGSLPCFKCHSYRTFSATPKKGLFSHRVHINSGYHCNQCHDFKGHRHIAVNRDICGNCHGVKTISFNRTNLPSRFNHEGHAKNLGCRECHPGLFVMKAGTAVMSMKGMDKGEHCGACHNGKKAFSTGDCAKCHELKKFGKDIPYKGGGLGKVVFSHTFHTAAFSCGDCHPKIFAMKRSEGTMSMDMMSAGKFCGACHNGGIASAVSDCARCHVDGT